jgi:hypothetical protein
MLAMVAALIALIASSPLSVSGSSANDDAWGARPRLELTSWVPEVPECASVVERFSATPPVSSTPPRDMPSDLSARFTANGAIATGDFFVDDTIGGKGSHYQYPAGVSFNSTLFALVVRDCMREVEREGACGRLIASHHRVNAACHTLPCDLFSLAHSPVILLTCAHVAFIVTVLCDDQPLCKRGQAAVDLGFALN